MEQSRGITRREALKRGAVFGGALVWTTPIVQAVGMSAARAQEVSPTCLRYALKWEVDGNTATGELTNYLPDQKEDALPLWTNLWVALGGRPVDQIAGAVEPAAEPLTVEEPPGVNEDGESGDASVSLLGESGDGDDPTVAESGGGDDGVLDNPGQSDDATPGDSVRLEDNRKSNGPDNGPNAGPFASSPLLSQPQAPGPPSPPRTPPGNCLIPPDDAINDDRAAATLTNRSGLEFKVYGDPEIGFWVAFPADSRPADIGTFAAAKCGNDADRCAEVTSSGLQYEADPSFPGYNRIFIPACSNGKAISHLELILDVCPD